MSRNRDRLGTDTTPQSDATPPQQLMTDTESFSFVVPSEFVELPSKGRFYPTNHPLYNQEVVEIKHMTAKEEDILTSQALLRRGLAIDKLLQSLIKNTAINAQTLLVGDRNAIMIAARISGYGPDYETQVTCPSCGTQTRQNFDLSQIAPLDTSTDTSLVTYNAEENLFVTTLPATKVEVGFRLMRGIEEKNITSQIGSARKRKTDEHAITRQLKQLIVTVNGDTNPESVNYLVQNIPSRDSRHLRLMYKICNPDVDMTHIFVCEDCGHEDDLEVPLTADFFWPDR